MLVKKLLNALPDVKGYRLDYFPSASPLALMRE